MPLLLNQVYEGSFDIHLVDDQSTDGTQEAIQTWQSLYPKKIFLHTLQHDQAGGKKSFPIRSGAIYTRSVVND